MGRGEEVMRGRWGGRTWIWVCGRRGGSVELNKGRVEGFDREGGVWRGELLGYNGGGRKGGIMESGGEYVRDKFVRKRV